MNYYQYTFTVNPPEPGSDILIACIADSGFESFENTNEGFIAYIPENLIPQIDLSQFQFDDFNFSYTKKLIEQVNWNQEWEKNFSPVIVSDACCIRAPFHHLEKTYTYDIIIMPKMSFGTGHHDTTWLVCKNMLDFDFKNKSVFDMGCGTGVLAILSKKLGASSVVGNDIDEWSVENALENCMNNNCSDVEIIRGDGNLFSGTNKYDFILANINKNVLKTYIPKLVPLLKPKGFLFLSGFFKTDTEDLISLCTTNYLILFKQELKNEWAVLILQKQS